MVAPEALKGVLTANELVNRFGVYPRLMRLLCPIRFGALASPICRSVDVLNKAIHTFGSPDIMNTDLGPRFMSFAWTAQLR